MSIFNPGSEVTLSELRSNAISQGWSSSANISMSALPTYYHGGQYNLGWYQNKNFRKFKLINNFQDLANISLLGNPSVSISLPYYESTGTTNLASISPKLISHNDYTVTLTADTPYGWIWQGWYSGINGSGTLLASSPFPILSSTSATSTYSWYGYHITLAGHAGGFTPKCLDGNSNILMADGTYKKVKDLETGELLKSKAVSDKPNTGYKNDWEAYVNWNDLDVIPTLEDSNSMVDDVFEIEAKYLKVINGGLLKMALTHPVLVKKLLASGETGWTVRSAFNIEEGDIILGDNGEEINVTSVEVQEGDFTLYDLYVVGNDTIHVNNVILPVNAV